MATYANIELQHITSEPLAPPHTPVDNSLESTPQHIFVNTEPPVDLAKCSQQYLPGGSSPVQGRTVQRQQ